VQFSGLYIFKPVRSVFSNDGKGLSVFQLDNGLFKEWRTDAIHSRTWSNRIETQLGEDHERGKSTSIFISRNPHQVIAEPLLDQGLNSLLGLPRLTSTIVQVRDM